MPFKTEEARREYNRDYHKVYYAANRQGYIERRRAAQIRNKAISDKIKAETPCTDCGVSYNPFVMDFDHVTDDKDMDISQMVRMPVGVKRLMSEIAKCEVVCANCHRMRTLKSIEGPLAQR